VYVLIDLQTALETIQCQCSLAILLGRRSCPRRIVHERRPAHVIPLAVPRECKARDLEAIAQVSAISHQAARMRRRTDA
jgi:hypothetical protein